MRKLDVWLTIVSLLTITSCGSPTQPPPPPSPSPTIAPSPSPTAATCPKPTTCPTLTRFGNKAHNVMNAQHQDIANEVCNADRSRCRIPVGGFIVYDSTPGFGPDQRPCNSEHPETCQAFCGALVSEMRQCEPVEGPEWEVSGPVDIVQLQENDYQLKVRITGAGTIRTRTCAQPGMLDGEGFPIDAGAGNCFTRAMVVEN